MNVYEKKLSEITPYENNPRNNEKAVTYVANSIREFGFRVPIVIDKDGIIVAGHTRLKAAIQLGLETAPCIIADDLTDEQVKAYRLADNKVSEFATWDDELLNIEMGELLEIDMSDFGFDTNIDEPDERRDLSDSLDDGEYQLIVEGTEDQLSELYERLMGEGYECRIST